MASDTYHHGDLKESLIIEGLKLFNEEGAVALKNLHTIYCFANLKLTQYIVVFILSATAPFKKLPKFLSRTIFVYIETK
ncbi:hypothetical protein LAV35_02750 [Clostridium sporogenes]|nr:hypothetical protein [Clostridium sporogenes]MCW6067106.1 hypothetical protein [Clostridium sporogenes]